VRELTVDQVSKLKELKISEERVLKYHYSLLFFGFFTIVLFAQTQSEHDMFDRGLNAYRQGRYQEAQSVFLQMLQDYPNERLTTASRLMLGKSYYKLDDYSRTEVICRYFFNKHPESSYLDDMHHLLGNTMFKLRRYNDAVEEWLWVIQHSKDPRLKRTSGEYIYKTMEHFLTRRQIEELQRKYQDNVFQGLVTIVLAKKMMEQGNTAEAQSLLKTFLREQPNHFYADEARKLLGTPTAVSGARNGFVYFKPLSGDVKKLGEEIEQGMRYALLEHQHRNPNERVNFQSVEVEPSVIGVLSAVNQAIVNADPLCLIGPIDSDQCAALSMISRYEKRPYIVPLSSQTGLTELSPFTFQINPDARTKGRFLGNYAVKDLGAKRVAVLAPVNEYGETFVQSFVEEVQAGGSDVVAIQWYYETTQDYSRQFRAIWREGHYLAFTDSMHMADSSITEDQIKQEYRNYLDMLFQPNRLGIRKDSTDFPSTGIDAVLIVIRSSQFIQYIAPQFAFNNIKTTLLGNEGWNDPAQLKRYKDHLEGLTYITAGYFDPNSTNYRVFMNRFRTEMNITPELYHMLGYDIMKWMLTNYRPGISSEALRNSLENTALYKGVLENIQFTTTPRVNSRLTVLKLNLGQIINVGL
jgi:ABC-type branched-subunit amino acid transport system substrate-binding protein